MKTSAILLALAPNLTLAEPTPTNVPIQNVISAVGPNWNAAGSFKAVLLREGEFAALYIFRDPYDETPLVYAPHAAITGDYWASVPWLEFDEGGALLLHSENRAFGRNKWEAMITIIERNNRFIVSGYTYSAYDSLNPDDYTDCTIDMLAQSLTVNGAVVAPFPLPPEVSIEDWTEGLEGACYVGLGN